MNKPGNHVHTHKMANEVDLEIREIPGFSDRTEIGIFVYDRCIGSFIVDKKRSKNLIIKPTMMRTMTLTPTGKETEDEEDDNVTNGKPSLTDITGETQTEDN